ncbi:MAG TPA: hypothetical protein VLT59_13615 [Steroidobacteraceae bacterium]|nr:hypothetical protein [Steroidobacteraceae bacterium]
MTDKKKSPHRSREAPESPRFVRLSCPPDATFQEIADAINEARRRALEHKRKHGD